MNWSAFYNLYKDAQAYTSFPSRIEQMLTGRTQMRNRQNSLSAQIDYENYLKEGNRRALADWHRNLPGRTIRYPELSYPGKILRSDTSIARFGFDYSTASANYYGNLPYRGAGLYGIGGRISRSL